MDFGANKTPIEVIKEGLFGGTHFRDIILVLMKSCTKIYGKNLNSCKILIRSFIVQTVMMSVSINMLLNAEHR